MKALVWCIGFTLGYYIGYVAAQWAGGEARPECEYEGTGQYWGRRGACRAG